MSTWLTTTPYGGVPYSVEGSPVPSSPSRTPPRAGGAGGARARTHSAPITAREFERLSPCELAGIQRGRHISVAESRDPEAHFLGDNDDRKHGPTGSPVHERAAARLVWATRTQALLDDVPAHATLYGRKALAGHTPRRQPAPAPWQWLGSPSPAAGNPADDSFSDVEPWRGDSPSPVLRAQSRAGEVLPVKAHSESKAKHPAVAGFSLACARTDAKALQQAIAGGHGKALLARMGEVLEEEPDYPAPQGAGKGISPATHGNWLALARLLGDSCLPAREGKSSQAPLAVHELARGLPLAQRASLLMALATQAKATGGRPNTLEDGQRLARLARSIGDKDLMNAPLAARAQSFVAVLSQFMRGIAADWPRMKDATRLHHLNLLIDELTRKDDLHERSVTPGAAIGLAMHDDYRSGFAQLDRPQQARGALHDVLQSLVHPLAMIYMHDLADQVGSGRIDATDEAYDLGRVMYACHELVPFTGALSPAERHATAFTRDVMAGLEREADAPRD